MLNKKKFTLIQNKNEKMFCLSKRHIKWRNYFVAFGLVSFALLLIFGNYKSQSYYKKIKDSKKEMQKNKFEIRSFQLFDGKAPRAINCAVKTCVVTCSGDMKDLKKYLQGVKNCASLKLRISDGIFPEDKLQTNWLEGSFNLSSIQISMSTLSGIENGAFNQKTVTYVSEIELNGVQLENLTENTFKGLKIETFTLVNKIENFFGDTFLKPFERTLKKLTIKHLTNVATDPGPWLQGGTFPKLMTIVFDGSNFGGYIKAATFEHLTGLSLLMMNSCKIESIADETFNFMMHQIVVIIGLENNRLKRLKGEYLSKVTTLKAIYIQNNPWDCSCNLEDLISNFKRYPSGFGENSKCSTPPEKSGKLLSEVVLDRCDEKYTTISTMKTTEADQGSSWTIASPTTTKPSIGNSTTVSDSVPSTISTLKTTTEMSPSSTTPDANPITVVSTASISSSSSSIPSTSILTTAIVKVTTPSPQNRTTTLSADSIFIECTRYNFRNLNTADNVVELSPPDGHFRIVPMTEVSAKLIFEGSTDDLAVIWFYEQPSLNGIGGSFRIVGEFNVGCQSELETSLVVEGLVPNRTYTFCLVKNALKVISPFNCRSYFTSVRPINTNETVWLRKKDKVLAISVFVVGIVIAICVGLLGMLMLLYYHPALLKGSKRVVVLNKSSRDVLLIPRPKIKTSIAESCLENSFNSEATTASPRRFSAVSGLSYMMANNYEDITYPWRIGAKTDKIYAIRVPSSPAPPLPERTSANIATVNRRVETLDRTAIEQTGYEYGYMSMP